MTNGNLYTRFIGNQYYLQKLAITSKIKKAIKKHNYKRAKELKAILVEMLPKRKKKYHSQFGGDYFL